VTARREDVGEAGRTVSDTVYFVLRIWSRDGYPASFEEGLELARALAQMKSGKIPAYRSAPPLRVGRMVRAGRGASLVVGQQAKRTPYAIVVDSEGRRWKKALSTISVIE
jgi:hypothetical protein